MFTISVKTGFQASHQLTLPDGSKEQSHVHNWPVTAEVASEKLDQMGTVMDFHKLRAELEDIIAPFDNSRLDTIDYFQKEGESAEIVAKYICDQLTPGLPEGVKLLCIEVGEADGCTAKYRPQEN